MNKVLLEGRASGWELHSLYNELINFPPIGYKFIVNVEKTSSSQNVIHTLNRHLVGHQFTKELYDYMRPFAYYFFNRLNDGLVAENFDLTYASQHIIFRKEPWIVDLEHAGALVAYGKIRVFKEIIERYLESKYCRKIIPWTEMGRRTLVQSFNCKGFQDKIEVVNLAVHPKKFRKIYDDSKITLLFVGTANPVNIRDSFAMKGGNEALRSFEILCKEYKNLELVIRSYVPSYVRERCAGFKNIRIIDKPVPWKILEDEFKKADIFLFPGHSTPGMVILDAMSYELPVVATDVWANSELVDDGQTGLLIEGSRKVRYHNMNLVPLWGAPSLMRAIRQSDQELVKELVAKVRVLIEDVTLRRYMGKVGRREIEEGKFSIIARNKKLKRIFDEAIEC